MNNQIGKKDNEKTSLALYAKNILSTECGGLYRLPVNLNGKRRD